MCACPHRKSMADARSLHKRGIKAGEYRATGVPRRSFGRMPLLPPGTGSTHVMTLGVVGVEHGAC
jgi:hypothetical protein